VAGFNRPTGLNPAIAAVSFAASNGRCSTPPFIAGPRHKRADPVHKGSADHLTGSFSAVSFRNCDGGLFGFGQFSEP